MEYRVLARKYRPSTFADLIGQEVLVKTLGNAFASGRVAHAFVLTGIRGIGKTTTARIIARALNCEQGPTITPCGVCTHCTMIAEDRHPDVLEMDAASRTGVGDIRDLIETVRYAPTSARNKVYIIDEVHMLSTSAFNALLKTLEEPPPHVKFIFATTEARKIPVTILSRCQRFDLKRVALLELAAHLKNICAKEAVSAEEEALMLIATAAEGSVRDSLSLLDQAMAHADQGVSAAHVRSMLGLTDRTQSFELLRELCAGDINAALARFSELNAAGADPLQVLNDVLTSLHFATRLHLSKEPLSDPSFSETEKTLGGALAAELSMPVLTRMWQLLLKGVNEVKFASLPLQASEMVLIRAAYASELPTPEETIRKLQTATPAPQSLTPNPQAPVSQAPVLVKSADPLAQVADFATMVALFEARKEALIASKLKQFARLVSFAQGEVQLNMGAHGSREEAKKMSDQLSAWTGETWRVVLAAEGGEATLADQEKAARVEKISEVKANPMIASMMAAFPGAEVVEVR